MPRSKPDDGLRPIFKRELELLGFHMQSIETGGTGSGIPDTNYATRFRGPRGAWQSAEGWIEYKATSGHAVDLKPEQIGWIERRLRCGGRVHIAVRRRHQGGPRLGASCDELYLLPGALAREARLNGLRAPSVRQALLGMWVGGPTRWDWPTVARCLTDI